MKMDPVDVLTMAVQASQEVRDADDPEAALAGGYGVLAIEPPKDRGEAMTLRIRRPITGTVKTMKR